MTMSDGHFIESEPACREHDAQKGGLTGAERRELIRRGHGLQARIILGRQGITDAFVAQLDQAMRRVDLLKVRIEADSSPQASRLAGQVAGRINAHVVQRVGRVALLHRPVPDTAAAGTAPTAPHRRREGGLPS